MGAEPSMVAVSSAVPATLDVKVKDAFPVLSDDTTFGLTVPKVEPTAI